MRQACSEEELSEVDTSITQLPIVKAVFTELSQLLQDSIRVVTWMTVDQGIVYLDNDTRHRIWQW